MSCLFVSISVLILASQKFSLNNTLFLYLAYLWLCSATLCDIRGDLNIDRALLLGRGMPKIDDESQYNHGERREVKPVWLEVEEEKPEKETIEVTGE